VAAVAHHASKKGAQQQAAADQQQAAATAAPPPAAPFEAEDPMAELTKLKGLLDAGILTQAEFDEQKAKILATM